MPNGDEVAECTEDNEEMENGVHVFAAVERVKSCTGYIHHALGYYPCDGLGGKNLEKRTEGNDDRESHTDEREGFEITVVFEFTECEHRTC